LCSLGQNGRKKSKHNFQRFEKGRNAGGGAGAAPLYRYRFHLKDANGGKLVSPLDSWPSQLYLYDTYALTIEIRNTGKQEQE